MKRIPALDGLRAVAIVMVVGYHIDKTTVPAGFWGVIFFLVLSGYLITRLLSAEIDRYGEIDLRFFYLKRGIRLYPALIILCVVLVVGGTDWSQVLPTLGQYSNYARIEGFDLGLLTHTWFLAVMAHFYLLWPLVIAILPGRHRLLGVGLLALAAIAWRALAIGVMSPGWVYNATDANAAALLAGAFLAVARPRGWRFAGWAIPALLVLMLVPVFGERGSAFLWGPFIPVALGVLAIQYAITRPEWLETPSIVWLGKISYGLYLWHYIFLRIEMSVWVALPLTVVVAAASWYLMEKPLQRWRARFEKRERTSAASDRHELSLTIPAN